MDGIIGVCLEKEELFGECFMDIETIVTPKTIDDLKPKMKVAGKVLKTSLAGAIVDLGIDVIGVIHISRFSKEPVTRVEDIVAEGQEIEAWVYRINPKEGKLELTMIEPLEIEWRDIKPGMEFKGTVSRIEKYGIFVDIGTGRPGLVHISEMAHGYVQKPTDLVKDGDNIDVQVLKVDRRKKQIKLSMKALEEPPTKVFKEEILLEEKSEPVPTAFEAALRQAMDNNGNNMDDILANFDN